MTAGEIFVVAGAAAIGWTAGRYVVETVVMWTNHAWATYQVRRWEKKNPEMAAARQRAQEQFMGQFQLSQTAPPTGQYH